MGTRDEQVRTAWSEYASRGQLRQDLLRPPVFRAWERSHDGGASPLAPKAEQLGEADTTRLLRKEALLITAARPYMTALSRAAGDERHAAMLADARAVVLDVIGDEATVSGPEPFPGAGTLLSEDVSGANGIGTPLVEGGYVELEGPEHFISGFHPFTCQGTPIHDAEGRVVGSLSTSVRRPVVSKRLREILVCAAHGVEAELLAHRLEEDVRSVIAAPAGDDVPLEALRQDVLQAQSATRLQLEAASRRAARDRLEEARRWILLAQGSIRDFQRRARLFRELATRAPERPGPLDLANDLAELVDLLQTEASVHHASLELRLADRPSVFADRRAVGRSLLRAILDALDGAGPGGSVAVALRSASPAVEVTVDGRPGGPDGRPVHRHFAFQELPRVSR